MGKSKLVLAHAITRGVQSPAQPDLPAQSTQPWAQIQTNTDWFFGNIRVSGRGSGFFFFCQVTDQPAVLPKLINPTQPSRPHSLSQPPLLSQISHSLRSLLHCATPRITTEHHPPPTPIVIPSYHAAPTSHSHATTAFLTPIWIGVHSLKSLTSCESWPPSFSQISLSIAATTHRLTTTPKPPPLQDREFETLGFPL